MISQIVLKNFMIHKRLVLDLHPGVNALVGISHSGKSAIIRGIKWCLLGQYWSYRRPSDSGSDFRTWGTDCTEVSVTFDSKIEVARIKTDTVNRYEIREILGEGKRSRKRVIQKFDNFGINVPEAVQEIVNLNSINFQNQLDPLYLLFMSPSEIGKELNELAGLDLINTAYSKIDKRLWDERQQVKTQKALKEKLNEDLSRYQKVETFAQEVSKLEGIDQRSKEEYGRCLSLNDLSKRITDLHSGLEGYTDLPPLQNDLLKLYQLREDFLASQDRGLRLTTLSDLISVKNTEMRRYSTILEFRKELESLELKRNKLYDEEKRSKHLSDLSIRIQRLSKDELNTLEQKVYAQADFNRLMPETCPICGRSG